MYEVYILLGGRFVFIRQCSEFEAHALCTRYAKMGTVAAYMPAKGGDVSWFGNKPAANNPRYLGAV
jgi:hypothetical protein